MASTIATRFLVLSDTHGERLMNPVTAKADVVIHCGDLTEESKLEECRTAVKMLTDIDAPLKLVIAGNHDFSLDDKVYQTHRAEVLRTTNDDQLVKNIYGDIGGARAILDSTDAKQAGIVFLDEGVHHFDLKNGAHLTVYASPYTASKSTGWGFHYNPEHEQHPWKIDPDSDIDVVMTHSPPKGVLDYTDGRSRAGIPELFEAVAHAKPKLHCYGHVHEAWGAKLVTWREKLSEAPSHFTDIDNEKSRLIDSRAKLNRGKLDTEEEVEEKEQRMERYQRQGYREIDDIEIRQSEQTLFVNAAIEGTEAGKQQLPWLIDVQLPRQQRGLNGDETKKRSLPEAEEGTGENFKNRKVTD